MNSMIDNLSILFKILIKKMATQLAPFGITKTRLNFKIRIFKTLKNSIINQFKN